MLRTEIENNCVQCTFFISLPDNLDKNLPLPGPIVMIDQDDLLPSSENQAAIADRHGDSRPHHGRAKVRESIIIAPGLRMPAVHSAGKVFLKVLLQIINESGFIFNS